MKTLRDYLKFANSKYSYIEITGTKSATDTANFETYNANLIYIKDDLPSNISAAKMVIIDSEFFVLDQEVTQTRGGSINIVSWLGKKHVLSFWTQACLSP